ncbi:MAG: chemotaxis protein CheC [Kofleriaceae bacterium]
MEAFVNVVIANLRRAVGIDAVIAAIGVPAAKGIVVSIDLHVGEVTWVFPQPLALALVEKMLAVPDPSPELAVDGATELANILTGQAMGALEKHGFRCQLGPPRVHVGDLPRGASVRMATSAGPIDLVLRLAPAA